MKTDRAGRLRDHWTTVDGFRVYARVALAPPPGASAVVCVHGYGVSSAYMTPIAEALALRHAVYAPDLPGWGRSDNPPRALMIPELADTLARWMDAAGIERAALLGNSMGCQIIVDFALRHPERVTHAVLVGPTIDPRARSAPRQILRLLRDMLHEKPAEVWITLRDYARFGVRRGIPTARDMLRDPIEQKLPRVEVPTLVVRGSRDAIVSQRWAEDATRLLPQGQLVIVPDSPHAVNYHAPTQLAQVVRAFLRETGGTIVEPRRAPLEASRP